MESLATKKLANKERVINILLSRMAKLEYEVERLEKENNLLKQIVGNDTRYSYGIRIGR